MENNSQSKSIYKLLVVNLHQIQKVENYVKGYIDGKEKLELFMKEYTDLSKTKFIIRTSTCKKSKEYSDGNVGNGATCTRYGQTDRIFWEFNNRNLHVPFTGMPFLTNSSQVKHCQHGSQYYKLKSGKNDKLQTDFNHWPAGNSTSSQSTSITRNRNVKPSKKRNCPAYMYIREVVLFPDFAIKQELLTAPKHTLRKEKSNMVNNLKQALQCGNPTSVHRFFVEVPLPEAHSDHPADANVSPMRVINSFIKSKMDELLLVGNYEKRHVELIIQDYVKEALLLNASSVTQSGIYPTEEEIRDYIHFSAVSTPTVVEVQTKEVGSNEITDDSHATIQSEMEKRVGELKVLIESCSDNETLQMAKVQMKTIINKLKASAVSLRHPSRQLGKRNCSFDPTEQIDSQKRRKALNNAFQDAPSNDNPFSNYDVMLRPDHRLQNHMQFHPNEINPAAPHQTEENTRFTDTSMLATFSRLMESDQDILPSLVDHVIADSSHFRANPSGYVEYAHFQNR